MLTISTPASAIDARCREGRPEGTPGEYVAIGVTDDAEGMERDLRDRPVEPFFTTRERGRGGGLGLSMVSGFTKQANGHVAIRSEPEPGTTVRLHLPCVVGAVPAKPRSTPESAEERGGSDTVLVVEDDPFARSCAVARLSRLG